MGRALPGIAVAVALLGAAEPASALERKSRRLSSQNALWSLQMVVLEEGKCRLEAYKDRDLGWSLEQCLGGADDLYFIANDGARFWVLKTLPEKPEGKKRSTKALLGVTVAELRDAKGNVLAQKSLGDFFPKKKLGELKQLTKHFRWLQGVVGERGVGPRLTHEGRVEFETLAGKTQGVPLEKRAEEER